GFVGPLNDAFAADDVQANGAVFKEIFEVFGPALSLLFNLLALRNILEAINRPLDFPPVIPERTDVDERRKSRAVRTLHYDFCVPSGRPGTDGVGHGPIG